MHAIRSGTAVIFNNIKYSDDDIRSGSEKDEANLKTTLESLGLKVTVHRDVDTLTLQRELQKGKP